MIKKIIKFFLPNFIIKIRENFLINKELKKFSNMDMKEVFSDIYQSKYWTPELDKKNFKFYSGIGSHYDELTKLYLEKIKEFIQTLPIKPNVVDLGCGDFKIGSSLRQFCNNYVAIDIFDELIIWNKKEYKNLNVDFRTLDITKDPLPSGDICFLRQVLQHLSNDSINKFLKSIKGKYKYLIITEHLPDGNFTPNKDISTGPYIRLYKNSGVVLAESPFNLKSTFEKNICSIKPKSIDGFEGVINTKIIKLIK